MRALDRKLVREVRRTWSQILSIAALVACGVMAALGMRSTLGSIRSSRDAYYAGYRFAHVWATVTRAPEAVAARVAAIPGVAAVQTRIVENVTLDVPGLAEPATGELVSIPEARTPMLNDLHIRRGRYLAPGRADEALVSERFAEENRLQVGDTIGAVLHGRWECLHVVGIAMSPEFVIEMGTSGFLVDNRRFGIVWVGREALEAAFDMKGAFNQVAVLLAPGASESAVVDALDRLLERYGGRGAYGRKDQTSHNVLSDEFEQLRVMANMFPVFFLGVAAFLLNVVLSRLVAAQRDEIAALKAFGYTDAAVGAHYLGFALVAVVLGSLVGIGLGRWMGLWFLGLYGEYFRFPVLQYRTGWAAAAGAVAVSGGAAMLGALVAVRAAVRLPPAEALRPEAPARFRPLLLERLGLVWLLSPAVRMVLRNLERRPLRTIASIVGIALAGALLITGLYPQDGMQRLMDLQFREIQREDLTIAFGTPRQASAELALRHIAGVTVVEGFRTAPVRLRQGHRMRTVAVTGLPRDVQLRRLVDASGSVHPVPPAGMVLTASLASALHAGIGDTLTAELLERGGDQRPVPVAGILDEPIGTSAYMERRALNRLLREGDVINGAYLGIAPGSEGKVYARLKRLPAVAGSSSRSAMLATFERNMAESLLVTVTIVVASACVIAVAVIYNGARIALSERGRELASLRVLGFTRGEVSAILLGEQGILTVVGIPLGLAIGYGFAALLAQAFASERLRFPLVVEGGTYLVAAVVVAVAATLAALTTRRRLNRLDLIAVLKTRE